MSLFFRFSLELVSFNVVTIILFSKFLRLSSIKDLVDLIVKDLDLSLIINLIVEDLKILSLEDLILDLITFS